MTEPNRIPVLAADAPPPTGPYSQAIRSGGFLFLAGQGPFRPDGSKVESSFEEQARQAFSNLQAVAAAAGAALPAARRVRGGVFPARHGRLRGHEQGLSRIPARADAGPNHDPA